MAISFLGSYPSDLDTIAGPSRRVQGKPLRYAFLKEAFPIVRLLDAIYLSIDKFWTTISKDHSALRSSNSRSADSVTAWQTVSETADESPGNP